SGLVFIRTGPPPSATLFPYPTLFRSYRRRRGAAVGRAAFRRRAVSGSAVPIGAQRDARRAVHVDAQPVPRLHARPRVLLRPPVRSEEHTSELQSREKHVCRLMLEKEI